MRRLLHLGILLAAGAVGLAGGGARAGQDLATQCAVPDELSYSNVAMPQVAARLKAGEPVPIVVMGSGSSAGYGLTQADAAYPARLVHELEARFPHGRFTLANLSRRGQLAAEMERRIATEVVAMRPALVIWQTGTVDAVRSVDLGSFAQTINDGIDILDKHDIDVILMDMQYSPHTSTTLNEEPYRDNMRWISQSRSVMLFDRYGIMHEWGETGVIDFSDTSKADMVRDDNTVHACIAYLLAEMIETAVKATAIPETPRQ
ncbi:MAG TPA: SGNH/GDSL hydrolase family protein [Alphaproteobacteria bacterium]|nr:SGNH/GDSL hydrolase family protein [Alphaproteobacteria bacterium]